MIAKIKRSHWTRELMELIFLLLIVFLIRTYIFGLYQVPSGSMETTMLEGERFFSDKFTILFSKPKRSEIIALNNPTYSYSSNVVMRWFQEYVYGPDNYTKRVIGIAGDHIKGVIEEGRPVIYLNDKKLDEPYLNRFPLIAVWAADPVIIQDRIDQLLKKNAEPNRIEDIIGKYWKWRSYDAAYAFDQQPYYKMNPHWLIHLSQGEAMQGVMVTSEGMLLEEPGKPTPAKTYQPYRSLNGGDEFDVILGKDEYWLMGDNRRGSADSRYFGPVKQRLIHGRILWRIWSIDTVESWWIVDLIKHPIDFWKRMRWCRFFQRVK